MSSSSPPAAGSTGTNISSLADGIFFGIIISTVLWGITIVQTWTYINNNDDKWTIRSLVGALFIMDTATFALTTEMAHYYLLQNFGNLAALAGMPTSTAVEVTLNVVIVFMVECFFAHRVYLLNGRRWLFPSFIVFFAVAALICGMFIIADTTRVPTVAHLASRSMKIEVALTNAFSAASDVLATIGMSWSFVKGKGGIKKTNTLLERLLVYTVARGGLVTVAQILTLILYVSQPTSLNWMPIHFCLCKLYNITMVVILNSRVNLRAQLHGTAISTFTESVAGSQSRTRVVQSNPGDAFEFKSLGNQSSRMNAKPIGVTQIHVSQEQVRDTDYRDYDKTHDV